MHNVSQIRIQRGNHELNERNYNKHTESEFDLSGISQIILLIRFPFNSILIIKFGFRESHHCKLSETKFELFY